MRLRLLIAVATLPLLVWALEPIGAAGSSLSSRIASKQHAIAGKNAQAQVLTSSIAGWTSRIDRLESDISGLEARRERLQSDLDAKLARLARIQQQLRIERARLTRLRARLAEARIVLARRLRDLYESGSPDILTVVLNSNGFADLLERGEFARRIGRQDTEIITAVKRAKAAATVAAHRLAGLEQQARAIAASIQSRRDAVVQVKETLVHRRDEYAVIRTRKRDALSHVRIQNADMEGDLEKLQAQQQAIQARLARAATGPGVSGPIRAGHSGLIWPVNGPIVSPFGMRWGVLHAGVDIAVPSGTPVHAAAAGSVIIAGWVSGYGNYVCIQHSGPLSTCYGHNERLVVSVGQHVAQGQVISYSDCTGHCFGPHVHFETRVNGTPVDPMGYL
jgi:peptidoglycan DL-endopeptidase CwlO